MAAGSPVTLSHMAPATATRQGPVKQSAAVADSVASDVATLVTDFNGLLAKLRAAGILASS